VRAYISKLKCRNFKSFKKVDIGFVRGFQALFGPNGSGKSNVCDSIRFVLGEMKFSALRAKKISDLINHDADHAEVTLVVETPDGEITVQRRVNREGKSGYRMNGKAARRGSVIELLKKYDIENGTHNVIGQGEVQRIVEMGAVERRKIIDEIAGVAEFDAKRDEALKELDTVQRRIDETKLILKEKEGFLKELEGEKEKAVAFTELKQAVTNLRNSVIYYEVRKVEAEYEEATKNYAMMKTKISDIENEIARIDERIRTESAKINELSNSINGYSTDNKAYREYEMLRTEMAVLAEKRDALGKRKEELYKKVGELEKKKAEVEERVKGFGIHIPDTEKKLLELKARLKELKFKADMSKKRDSTLANESIRLTDEIAALEGEIGVKEKTYNELSLAVSQADYKINAMREEMEKLESAAGSEINAEAKEIERKIKEMEKELERKKKELDDLFVKERKVNEQNAETDKQLLKLKEEYSKYRSVSGYVQSEAVANFIKELRDKGVVNGIYGSVQDLCNFDSKYGIAIESAVGGRLNYIIVENIDASNEIITQLRNRKIGRATFLPLTMQMGDGMKVPNYPGVLGRLIDFVQFDPKFTAPMNYVFGDTLLINDIETAKDVGLVGKYRLVTLEGDIIEKSSAVTGGFFTSSLKITERKKAAEIEERIAKLQAEKEALISELFAIRDESSRVRRERSEIEVGIKALQIESEGIMKSAAQVEEAKAKAKELRDEIVEIERTKKGKAGELERVANDIMRSKEKLTTMRKKKSDIDSVLFNKGGENEEEMEALGGQVAALETELKGSSTESAILRKNADDIASEIESVKAEMEGCDRDIGSTIRRMQETEAGMAEKKDEIERSSKMIRELMHARDEVQAIANKLAEEKGAHTRNKERIMLELGKVETRKAVLEQKLVDLKSEASDDKFELIEGSITRLKEELNEKEGRLNAMGEVNMLAPKMYDERKAEIEEVSERLAKLEKEREAVILMIKEVEKRKIVVFMEAFEKVNANFQGLFSQTFSSGKAYLALQKPEEPFSGGLDVKVVVADDKEERIESLSGGEKSIIALLLVFAIHMYKPSAFYILDEVESALDKIRSKLVAELLKKLASKTQFIVVSHNDTIISSADAVFGVSKMNRESKVVGLALNTLIENRKPETREKSNEG